MQLRSSPFVTYMTPLILLFGIGIHPLLPEVYCVVFWSGPSESIPQWSLLCISLRSVVPIFAWVWHPPIPLLQICYKCQIKWHPTRFHSYYCCVVWLEPPTKSHMYPNGHASLRSVALGFAWVWHHLTTDLHTKKIVQICTNGRYGTD